MDSQHPQEESPQNGSKPRNKSPMPQQGNDAHYSVLASDSTTAGNTVQDAENSSGSNDPRPEKTKPEPVPKGWRFWAIFPGLCIAGFLSAIDATILSTVLPTIVNDLDSSGLYVWTINAYFLTMTAVQPIYGQTANIFGRRWLLLGAVALFAIGSALCGASSSTNMLIASRAVQGIGGGGINVMIEIVVSDLVPLRERQKYMGIVFGVFAVGTFIGPVLGGAIVDATTWRWVFYINLPISGVALILIFFFLQVNYDKSSGMVAKLKRVDFIGNMLLMASVVAILLALTWGGIDYPWTSWHILLPLILGCLGLIAFQFYQASKWCLEPTMPLRLFQNRTSTLTFALTFLHGVALYWLSFFLPVYFQAVLEASPQRSGVNALASAIPMVPFGIVGGILISVTGKYKPYLILGFVLMSVGVGLLTLLDDKTTTVAWVFYQIITAAGFGFVLTATLPAILASLPESDVATATATWAFIRSFGSIWGVAIPSAVFNTRFESLAYRISIPAVRVMMYKGGAYQLATKAFMQSLNLVPDVKAQVVSVYADSLRRVWQVAIAFAVVGVPIAFLVKELPMREQLDTEFGFENKPKMDPGTEKGSSVEKETSSSEVAVSGGGLLR